MIPANPIAEHSRWPAFIILILACAWAFFVRVYFTYDRVFLPGFVRFAENDPWYHVRAIEYLVANFPHRIHWDPYALHPDGKFIPLAPLLDYLVAGIVLVLGAGSPSLNLVHHACAWIPAILGALLPVPAFFLSKVLFGRPVGLLCAIILAVLPGEILIRSTLGFPDHHVLEALLSTTAGCLLIRSFQFHFSNPQKGPYEAKGFIIASALGVVFGLYLLSWVAGSLLVLLFFVAAMVEICIEQLRGRDVQKCLLHLAFAWLVAFVIVLPFRDTPRFDFHVVALSGSCAFMIAAAALALIVNRWGWPRWAFVLGLAPIALGGFALAYFAGPHQVRAALAGLRGFVGGQAANYVLEGEPLLYDGPVFSLRPAYEMFQLHWLSGFVGLLVLARRTLRRQRSGDVFFVVWCLMMLGATLVQERFGYYLAANIALLAAIAWDALAGASQAAEWISSAASRRIRLISVLVLFAFAGILPSVLESRIHPHSHFWMHPDWQAAMTWMRENTPPPVAAPFTGPFPGVSQEAYKPEYGIMAWWDYGYWITGLGHRPAVSNPTQAGLHHAASFFSASDPQEALKILADLKARYVIVDADMPMTEPAAGGYLSGSLEMIIRLRRLDLADFYEPLWEPQKDGSLKQVVAYYPRYFQCMLNRLYVFGANAVTTEWNTWAIHYSTASAGGQVIKRIDQKLQFRTYEKAMEFLREHAGENWKIASFSPDKSCVPMENLDSFRRVYHSPTPARIGSAKGYVEIFEVLRQEAE